MTTWYFSDNPNGFRTGKRFSIDDPCLTIMADGLGGDSLGHWHVASDGREDIAVDDVPRVPHQRAGRANLFDAPDAKPPYRVPLMAEVVAVPWNGLTVASLFAGCGGSSTGYRMAGYRVLWASEFVPVAVECYKLNAPGTIVDPRDVKDVTAEDILKATGLKVGELDLLDGSPPCQAFSTAGRRHKNWGTERRYEHGASQKNEDLFFEYVRILRGLQPRTFVAENVSGLVKGVAKGYFIEILKELKASGYRVKVQCLDAQWLGVPQARQRVFFVGVREDLGLEPAFPVPLPHRYSVREAIPWLGRVVQDTKAGPNYNGKGVGDVTDRPCPAITVGHGNSGHYQVRGKVVGRTRFGKQRAFEDVTDRPSITVRGSGGNRAAQDLCIVGTSNAAHSRKGEARSVEQPAGTVMARRVNMEVQDDGPSIERYAIGAEARKLNPGQASKKYMSLVRVDAAEPCPTVAAQAGGETIAGVVAPDGRRKFTIAELRRICSFPDDFRLVGTYAQQWERLGNSVPPLMARAVAEAVRDRVLLPAREAAARKSSATPRASGKGGGASKPKSKGAAASRARRKRRRGQAAPTCESSTA